MADGRVLVIGIGNELRGDDGAGLEVVRRLREPAQKAGIELHEHQREPIALLEVWGDARVVVLVDTMRSGAPPGTIRCMDAGREPLPARLGGTSSVHALGLGDAIELARTLGRLPPRLIVFAVEGRSFTAGAPLSGELAAVVASLARRVLDAAVAPEPG